MFIWCPPHHRGGRLQPGKVHPRSRVMTDRRIGRVASRRVRPASRICPAPPSTTGSSCASHAQRRMTTGARRWPVSVVPALSCAASTSKGTVTASCAGAPPLSGRSRVRSASRQMSIRASARRCPALRSSPGRGRHNGSSAAATIAVSSTVSVPWTRTCPSSGRVRISDRLVWARASAASRASRWVCAARCGATCSRTRSPTRRSRAGSRSAACRISAVSAAAITSSPASTGRPSTAAAITAAWATSIAAAGTASATTGRRSSRAAVRTHSRAGPRSMCSRARSQLAVDENRCAGGTPRASTCRTSRSRSSARFCSTRHASANAATASSARNGHICAVASFAVSVLRCFNVFRMPTIIEHTYDSFG